MTNCIVIFLRTSFLNSYMNLKKCMSCFLTYKSLMTCKCFQYIIYICHKNVQYNGPVGCIMISLYCWHSNVSKSFEIIIGWEQNVYPLTLRKLVFYFLSNSMRYDRGDSFPFDFEPNGIPFGSKSRKENCPHDHIPFKMQGNGNIVFSVYSQKQQRSDVQLSERLASLGIMGPN